MAPFERDRQRSRSRESSRTIKVYGSFFTVSIPSDVRIKMILEASRGETSSSPATGVHRLRIDTADGGWGPRGGGHGPPIFVDDSLPVVEDKSGKRLAPHKSSPLFGDAQGAPEDEDTHQTSAVWNDSHQSHQVAQSSDPPSASRSNETLPP